MTAKIIKVWWYSTHEIAIVFDRDISFVPEFEILGAQYLPPHKIVRGSGRSFAEYSSYYISDGKIRFMLDDKNFKNVRQAGKTNYYVCGDFNGWEKSIGDSKWKMKTSTGVFEYELSAPIEDLNLKNHRSGHFKFAGEDGRWLEPRPDLPNIEYDKTGNSNLRFSLDKTGQHVFLIDFSGMCSLSEDLRIKFPQLNLETGVDVAELLLQIYSNAELGVRLSYGKTIFSIFAPRAHAAYVRWWRESDKTERLIYASSIDGAIWSVVADEDLNGAYYTWHIDGRNHDNSTIFDVRVPVVDPYANAMLSSKGPCIVKYGHDLPFNEHHFHPPHWHDLVIMEAHVRDVLAKARADISSNERLTFEGLTKWLADEKCYIRASGVNCVELQPIQEFTAENSTDYEWGYMPVNWFAPASSYATDAKKATQNEDFARLVRAFHDAGIAVILDVVYNHIGEPNTLLNVDKEYYFETNISGDLMNFSGCGNDFRTRTPMSKRMIIDSLKVLVKNYGVDGFRFDLAELLGLRALKEIEVELKKVNPSVILIAEPWSYRGHIATALRDTGFSSWNDGFREYGLLFAQGNGDFEGFKYFISGSYDTATFPAQTVNYIESHDDKCFFDRITSLYQHPSIDDIRRYKIGYAFTLLSLGIPMVAEGFDIVRTKNGKNNTYKDGAENALDYSRGTRFTGVCDWMRSLVKFRLSHDGRILRCAQNPHEKYLKFFKGEHSNASAVMFNADGSAKARRIFAAFNPTLDFAFIPIENDIGREFIQIADIDRFDLSSISNPEPMILRGVMKLAPLSLCIWIEK